MKSLFALLSSDLTHFLLQRAQLAWKMIPRATEDSANVRHFR
jgi:hypothetical protein